MSQTLAPSRNQHRSRAALLAGQRAIEALLATLTAASADHFGADPERVLWTEAPSLARVEELLAEAVAFIEA